MMLGVHKLFCWKTTDQSCLKNRDGSMLLPFQFYFSLVLPYTQHNIFHVRQIQFSLDSCLKQGICRKALTQWTQVL